MVFANSSAGGRSGSILSADDRQEVLFKLGKSFGDSLSLNRMVRDQHCHSTTWLKGQPPDAVLFATNRDDVAEAVRICAAHRLPVIGFGVDSSVEGQVNAPRGGLCIDMSRMTRMLDLYRDDMQVRVEPGMTREMLNDMLSDTGLFFPIDPGANASLGGMASTRASGTNAVRYGTMREAVLSAEVVLANGSVIETGTRAKKSAAGYDLTRLVVGAEGTLGLITALTVKLFGVPEVMSSGVCRFATVEDACKTVIDTIQYGIPVARIELLDAHGIRRSNAYSKLGLPEVPTLFLEFHGSAVSVAEQTAQFEEIASGHDGTGFSASVDQKQRKALWKARHDMHWASRSYRPGAQVVVTDACVPISRLAASISETEAEFAKLGFPAAIVGHVGDGNFHTSLLVDINAADEVQRAEAFVERLARRAIEMGGTCSGEHGIGQGKVAHLEQERGPGGMAMMRAIKQALDPDNIMNPGKMGL